MCAFSIPSAARVLGGMFVLVGIAVAATVNAQVLYGAIVGNVTDDTGGLVPGATVVITHLQTDATRETVTDANGAYRFPTVQTGTYRVVVSLEGFNTFSREVGVSMGSRKSRRRWRGPSVRSDSVFASDSSMVSRCNPHGERR